MQFGKALFFFQMGMRLKDDAKLNTAMSSPPSLFFFLFLFFVVDIYFDTKQFGDSFIICLG